MIREYFYSTLNDELYDSRSEAQKAEDEYVENYFKDLDRKAEIKRRIIRGQINKPKTSSKGIPIS